MSYDHLSDLAEIPTEQEDIYLKQEFQRRALTFALYFPDRETGTEYHMFHYHLSEDNSKKIILIQTVRYYPLGIWDRSSRRNGFPLDDS